MKLPRDRKTPARHNPGDPAQEEQEGAPDAGAKGAQSQDPLRARASRAHHRQAQALRASCRPVRRQRGTVQPGVQRDHRAGEPGSFVGLRAKGPAATGPVEDVGRLGQGLLPGACQVGFRAHQGAAGLRTSSWIL